MKPRTEIINNRIVNYVEQLAGFLKPGDIFRKLHNKTQYKFGQLIPEESLVSCENLETHLKEEIYFKSPVFKLIFI